ncbi:MAG: hypothetical protein HZB11_00255 [Candidatus Yonathbacteria bacterium]|nr:hypothetical protein [Candidatus Yonathbacteria bacterium]
MFTTKNLFALFGKHFLVTLGVLALASVAVFFLSNQIANISAKATSERRLATILSERTALLSNLKNETEIIGANDAIIKNSFIPSNNILGFVATLKNLALKTGLTQALGSFTLGASTIGTSFPVGIITYQNTVSSNVPMFINYLKEFEQLPYFTKIDSLSISAGGGDWSTSATISFSATVAAQTQ